MKLIFDAPMSAHDPLQRHGVSLFGREVGEDRNGLAAHIPGAIHITVQQANLLGARPFYAFGFGDRERALFEAVAVAARFAGDTGRRVGLDGGVDRVGEGGLVALDREDVGPPFSTIVLQTSRWVCKASPVTTASRRGSR